MSRKLDQGVTLTVPCRHCGQMALKAMIRQGEVGERCQSCQKLTRILMRLDTDGWRIWTQVLSESLTSAPR